MKILSVASFKGGVGKTQTVINLGALMAREGKRVLMIDADAQHNLTDFFCPGNDGPTLADVLTGEAEPLWLDNVQEVREGLDILPADMRLLTLDLAAVLNGSAACDKRMFDFLECVRMDCCYDTILFDCPPSFTTASVAALVCSDEVILPTRADAFSRAGALELIAQVQSLGRYHVSPRFRVLVTMTDRTNLSRQVEAQLRESGLDVFETVIPASVCVGESTYAKLPLYEYAPRCRAAQGYEALAREVLRDG